jgi:hypothetical protein
MRLATVLAFIGTDGVINDGFLAVCADALSD